MILKTVDAIAEGNYGSVVRLANDEYGDPLGRFLRDYGLTVGLPEATVVKKATGIRAVIMKSAVFLCTGKWPKQVNLG